MRRLKPDPVGDPRNPLAVFLLVLSLLSGLLIVVGVPSSGGIASQLPEAVSFTWGAALTFGATMVLAGMYWQGDQATGLLFKRVGFLALVVVSIVYSATLILFFGIRAFLSSGIVLGFAYACGLQYRRVNGVIQRIILLSATGGNDD